MSQTAIATVVVAILAVCVVLQPVIVLSALGIAVVLCVLFSLFTTIQKRQAAFPEAQQMLDARVQEKKAFRTKRYDLYLPTPNKKSKERSTKKAFMFLPGALVEHTAYAGIAIQLAEQYGIMVAVVSLEPSRLAFKFTGCSMPKILSIAKEIEDKVDVSSTSTKYEWSIGGHSLGANAAVSMFSPLQMHHGWKKLIILAAGLPPDASQATHLQSPLNRHNTLIIQAENDGFLERYKDQDLSFYTVAKIKGGNHAGVAHYGPQVFPVIDGERTIPLGKQQELTASAAADFIMQ